MVKSICEKYIYTYSLHFQSGMIIPFHCDLERFELAVLRPIFIDTGIKIKP